MSSREPNRPAPGQVDMRDLELGIVSDGYRLRGAAVLPRNPKGVVLLLHGIPSVAPPTPGDRGYAGLASDLAGRGFAAGWVDMRAVRGSEGHFSIEGWVRDATVALERLRGLESLEGLPAAIVGSSAGGAVAAEVARRGDGLDALALLAAPAAWVSFAGDPGDAIRRITEEAGMALASEVLDDPGPWAAEFGSVSTELSIAALDIPVLVVHGSDDDVVPVGHAARIASAARKAELRILPGAPHQLRHVPDAIDAVIAWLGKVLGAGGRHA